MCLCHENNNLMSDGCFQFAFLSERLNTIKYIYILEKTAAWRIGNGNQGDSVPEDLDPQSLFLDNSQEIDCRTHVYTVKKSNCDFIPFRQQRFSYNRKASC